MYERAQAAAGRVAERRPPTAPSADGAAEAEEEVVDAEVVDDQQR